MFGNVAGAIIMGILGALSILKWHETEKSFYLLLALRDLLLIYFFLARDHAQVTGSSWEKGLAYLSSALPVVYQNGFVSADFATAANILFIIGFLISTLALIDLGYSFGVSPCCRTRIMTGLYSHCKHPMYLGYIIAEVGMIIVCPIPNFLIFIISANLYLLRMRAEDQLLSGLSK
jgi:hypothetical protein